MASPERCGGMEAQDISDDEETERPKNAFEIMMQPPSKKAKVEEIDPIYTAVLYIRWLKWIDPSNPLFMCPYIGQAVRSEDTPEKVVTPRWKEEDNKAVREYHDIGVLHCLRVYGPEAFYDQIVESKRGPRSEVQEWANSREIALIAEHGGPLRDQSVRCKQTLNQDNGGKFGWNFESIDALRTVAWLKFKTELEAYVECYETSLVPNAYVNPVSGYKLGQKLNSVRSYGTLWKGHPDETARVAWLEALPKWAWNAMKTDEYKEGRSEISKEWRENATPEELAEWSRKQLEAHSTPAYKEAASKRAKAQVEREAVAGMKSLAERGKEWRDNATPEELTEWSRKQSEAQSKPASKAAASKRSKAQVEREAAAGMKSLFKRGKEWRENATPEQLAEMVRKFSATKQATDAAKRAKVLDGLTPLARNKKKEEYARTDRKQASRKGKANALLQLMPSYAEKGYQWCYRNFTQAEKDDGVVFSKDASNGVWSARVRGQGSNEAGSSADHARTEVEEEAPMESEKDFA